MTAEDRAAHVEREAVAGVLAAHHLSAGGRNLGQDRTEWTCACGETFVTDGHNGPSLKTANDLHLAAAVLAALPQTGDVAAVVVRVEALADKWDLIADANEAARGVKTKVAGYYRRHATQLRAALTAGTDQ